MNSIVKREQRNRALNTTHRVRNAGAVFGAHPTNGPPMPGSPAGPTAELARAPIRSPKAVRMDSE
jgi:hypothetical protein